MSQDENASALVNAGTKEWMSMFGEKHWLKCKVIDLSGHEGFVKWVLKGGTVRLPRDLAAREYVNGSHEYNIYTGEDDWGSGGEEEEEEEEEVFSELVKEIDGVFEEFGGGVFPMSNSRAPRDAGWAIANGEVLQCQNTTEVCLILKSSNVTTTEWQQRKENNEPLHLILRKWYNIEESQCFRCFVVSGSLVGVSQKRLSEFYPFLYNMVDDIKEAATSAFNAIATATPKDFPSTYAFDIYILKGKNKARLMGFHPITDATTLLFTPAELANIAEPPEIRIIPDRDSIVDTGVAASMKEGIPDDLKNFSMLAEAAERVDAQSGGKMKASVEDMINMMREQGLQ